MKLIIDIPEEIYKASKIVDVKYEDVVQIPLEVLANGTPIPDNATNGDILEALFPNAKVSQSKIEVYMKMGVEDTDIQCFDIEWWNAPYQKGEA